MIETEAGTWPEPGDLVQLVDDRRHAVGPTALVIPGEDPHIPIVCERCVGSVLIVGMWVSEQAGSRLVYVGLPPERYWQVPGNVLVIDTRPRRNACWAGAPVGVDV